MLFANCTPEAIAMNDPRGDLQRAGFRFDRMPVTAAWRWVDECTEVSEQDGRLWVKTHGEHSAFGGPRIVTHPIVTNDDRKLSHAAMLARILHNDF